MTAVVVIVSLLPSPEPTSAPAPFKAVDLRDSQVQLAPLGLSQTLNDRKRVAADAGGLADLVEIPQVGWFFQSLLFILVISYFNLLIRKC